MPHADPDVRREYRRQHYLKNRERIAQQTKKRRDEHPEIMRAYQQRRRSRFQRLTDRFKTFKGCNRCGYRENPAALQFHHLTPGPAVATLWSKGRADVKRELAKCEVLCANCHAIETATLWR